MLPWTHLHNPDEILLHYRLCIEKRQEFVKMLLDKVRLITGCCVEGRESEALDGLQRLSIMYQ